MLPGFRFLLAAIVLSMSILIFGLGAAALLRAAHEEVANVPTRRVMAEPVFAQPIERPAPTLALLRIEPAAPEKSPDMPAAAEPAPDAVPVPKVETEKLTALKLDDAAPAMTAKPEVVASEPPPPAPAEPTALSETKVATLAAAPAPSSEAAPPSELIAPPAMTDPGIAATETAALGSPAAKIEKAAETKKTSEKPDPAEIKKQKRAERARERRRQAARRARLAAQQAAVFQAIDPFVQPTQTTQPVQQPPGTTRRR